MPLTQETAISFQDSFAAKNPIRDARAWIYQILTKKGSEWVKVETNGGFVAVIVDENGNGQQDDVGLKDVDLEKWIPESDPEWIPELLDPENIQPFEIKIGTELFKKLTKSVAVTRYGTFTQNESLIEYENNREALENKKERQAQQDGVKKMEKDHENYKKYPLEKFLYGVLIDKISEKVREHDKKIMDKEFDELYPEEEKTKKKSEKETVKPESKNEVVQEQPEAKTEIAPTIPGTRTPRKQ